MPDVIRGLMQLITIPYWLIKSRIMDLKVGNIISIGTRPFEEIKSKATRAYTQSGQYHIIVEVRILNRLLTLTFHRI